MARLGIIATVLLVAGSSFATTIHVPADQPTIQAGIATASECDTILLAPGIYEGSANHGFAVTLKCLSIMSEAGSEMTILNLEGDFFIRPYGEYDWLEFVIVGLTFRGGSTAVEFGVGGGSLIKHCVFEQNETGIVADRLYTGGLIDSCVFTKNEAGILLWDEAYQLVRGNTFVGNIVGLNLENALNTEIRGNVIAHNEIGVKCSDYYGTWIHFTNNVIYANMHGVWDYPDFTWRDFQCNDVFGNIIDYTLCPDLTGIDGNISADPLLDTGRGVRFGSPLLPGYNDCELNIGDVAPACTCCIGRVGDVDREGEFPDEVTLGDIMLLVDVKFISGDCGKLPCIAEADVNQDGGTNPTCEDHVTLGDIMTLVDFLFISNTPLKECL